MAEVFRLTLGDKMLLDPPYKAEARDRKYNNYYVGGNDTDRHSKWISMMQKRLCSEGVSIRYGIRYADDDNLAGYEMDVIVFAAYANFMDMLHNYVRSAVRDRISQAMSNDKLDHIFDENGFFC